MVAVPKRGKFAEEKIDLQPKLLVVFAAVIGIVTEPAGATPASDQYALSELSSAGMVTSMILASSNMDQLRE